MKTVKNRPFGLLAFLLMSVPFWGTPGSAAQFDQTEITTPDNFVVVAAPAGRLGYGLVILEQLKNDRPCWDEVDTGTGLTLVNPLLTQFDFTGICSRSIDSNSYSVRTAGEDLGLQYSLRVLRQGNDLVLVAAANQQRNVYIPIGRTYGLPQSGEFALIRLDPSWRLSRRTFNGRSTGHLYLTNDQPISVLLAAASSPTSTAGPISPPPRLDPQIPSNSPLLPPPGSTSPLTESPGTRGTAQPGIPAAPVQTAPVQTTPVQIPVPPPEATATNPGNSSSPIARATLPPLLPNRPAGTPVTPPPPAPPERTTAANPNSLPPLPPAGTPINPIPLPSVPSAPSAGTTANPTPNITPNARPLPTPPATTATGITPPPIVVPAPEQPTAPIQTAPAQSAPQPDQRQATGIVYGYRVIVDAESPELQERVRSLAPQTAIVTVNGQPAVQAGLFRDLNSAEQLRQRLVGENLSVTIVPIR